MLFTLTAGLLLGPSFQDGKPVQDPAPAPPPQTPWELLSRKYDADRDGTVTAAEYDRGAAHFERLDRNADGLLSEADFDVAARPLRQPSGGRRGGGRPGGRAAAPRDPAPEVGTMAPDFSLPLLRAKTPVEVRLSGHRGKRPVALLFGSYT